MKDLANLMKAVSHTERLQVAVLIHDHTELSVSQIRLMLELRQASASIHLLKMQSLGFVISRRAGVNVYYSLSYKGRQLIQSIPNLLASIQ